jgi:Carboxypeptidase regulatory-like domain
MAEPQFGLLGLGVGPEIRRSQNGNDFKIDQVIPAANPCIQQFPMLSFHHLKTAPALRIHPARVIRNAFWQHAATLLEPFADRPRIAVLESLDHHEQHEAQSIRLGPNFKPARYKVWPGVMDSTASTNSILAERKGGGYKPIGVNSMKKVLGNLVWLGLSVAACGSPALAQSQQPPIAMATGGPTAQPLPDLPSSGSISGTVVDRTGAAVPGVRVRLTREDQSPNQEVLSGDDGQFFFANIAPGPFHLTITATGFETQTSSGILHSSEAYVVPQVALALAVVVTEVRVAPSPAEVAEGQIKDEEKQRVLGFIPNFYVSYVPNAAPLTPKRKFELAWRTSLDPVTFGLVGAAAGIGQAADQYGGYGQGAQGYGKRYGAAYGDFVIGTFIGSAILPSLLKQDPRYFYKGTGSTRSRILYAIANSVICKGDNGKWQPDYSSILGSLAAGGISNLYYPPNDRNGVGLTFENALIGIGANAATNIIQEFLIRKLTPNLPSYEPAKS